MRFNAHTELVNRHAFLSASKYAWLRYDENRLREVFETSMDAAMGTRLHAYASEAIKLGLKQPDDGKTLSSYINDAIGFKMTPEVILVATDNAFGTADAVAFRNKLLRIHDLKNGATVAKMDQLLIYACYFMIEYKFKPKELDIVLRIYQNDEVLEYEPELDELAHTIDKIYTFDELINKWKAEIAS
jgi:hypothetical protein